MKTVQVGKVEQCVLKMQGVPEEYRCVPREVSAEDGEEVPAEEAEEEVEVLAEEVEDLGKEKELAFGLGMAMKAETLRLQMGMDPLQMPTALLQRERGLDLPIE